MKIANFLIRPSETSYSGCVMLSSLMLLHSLILMVELTSSNFPMD